MFFPSSIRSSLNMRTLLNRNVGIGLVCQGEFSPKFHTSSLFNYATSLQSNIGELAHNSTFASSNLLSPTSKESCISKLKAEPSLRPVEHFSLEVTEDFKKSAVLVPLVDLNGSAGVVFTKRSKYMRSHRGEVSFPGGKQEPNDSNLVETACRETCEELGIRRDQIEVWTEMSPYSTYDRGGHVVTPVVGFLKNFTNSQLKVSNSEVDEVFVVAVSQLCDEKYQGYTQFKDRYSLPAYTGPPHVVWGLTALITFQMLRALVPRDFNKHDLIFQSSIQV